VLPPEARVPVLHVGILTYNGLAHTQRCLASLAQHTQGPWRALVRDNASQDGTPAWLHTLRNPRITVHCDAENLGVGGGRNWLLEQLVPRMHDDDLVVLLDNDIELHAGWETPFVHAFASQPRLGVAGRWAFSMVVHDGWRDVFDEHGLTDGPADTVQGCVFVIRAAAARAIGTFDTALGRFWHEDDDYAMRALAEGWDVRRVASDGITHHEHGSGVALRPDRVIGSARNQVYLTRKWRELGVIDADGVPLRPVPDEQAPLLAHLSRALGRRVLRSELNSALTDLTRLVHGKVPDALAALMITPTVRVLLGDMLAVGESAEAATGVLTRAGRLLAERRATAPGGQLASSASARLLSAVCSPAAWDDARWVSASETARRDGRGRDYYARDEAGWRDGQVLLALRTLGVLRPEARVQVVARPAEGVIAALSHLVGELEVRDATAPTAEMLQAHARMPLGAAVVRGAAGGLVGGGEGDGFDAVVVPNLSAWVGPGDLEAALRGLALAVQRGGVVVVGTSVRIFGPADGTWLEVDTLADEALLARAGLRRVGAFDARVADETLLAAVPEGAPATVRPRLARLVGVHGLSLAVLVARRVSP
jgi:GT2 family glycosyltransferase